MARTGSLSAAGGAEGRTALLWVTGSHQGEAARRPRRGADKTLQGVVARALPLQRSHLSHRWPLRLWAQRPFIDKRLH